MKAEIIAIGSEMLTPYRQDTNSLFITEELNEIGVAVAFKTIVGDRRKDLVNAIRSALGRTDIIILVGGLGPTEDDLTREAAAEALSLTLHRDNQQVAALHARAATWRIAMPSNNLKQADVIKGATVIPNPNGSAPGQWVDTLYEGYRKLIMLIPGPPGECKPLFETECVPRLREILPPRFIAKRTLKAAMIPESQADKLLAPIYTQYTDVETTILAHAGDIQLSLLCSKTTEEAAQARVDELASRMEEALDDWLYSSQGDSLEQIVLYYLGLRQATLAVAESCTGGLIAERITSVPGSSRSFLGGAIVYSNQLKISFANVAPGPDLAARSRVGRSGQGPCRGNSTTHRRHHRIRDHRRGRARPAAPNPSPSAWSTLPSVMRIRLKFWSTGSGDLAPGYGSGRQPRRWT